LKEGGYDHFMMKEIYEQRVIKDTYRGRLHANEGLIQMAGIEDNLRFLNADRIIIVACVDLSWHAGWQNIFFEEFTRIPVEVEYCI
jgi:glucosamine--fructose-6-phosphate aminotransferase (isomerizing)